MLLTQDKELDIFVGSKIGSFKHIKYHTDVSKNNKKCIENLVDIKTLQKDDSITTMVWGNAEQTEILIGKQNQQIQVYDTINGFTKTYTADFDAGHIVGLGRLKKRLVAALSNGVVKVWSKSEEVMLHVGGKIDRMRVYGDELVATGGEENDLKVWNVGVQEPVFSAKNLPHDWLQLRQPVWVSDVCFLDSTTLAVCSRNGYVRLYDTRAQRRPVCNVDTSMAAVCISPAHDERKENRALLKVAYLLRLPLSQVLVGFGRGQFHTVDLKRGRLDKGYKGATGAVSAVSRAGQLLVSAGFDRHLRVHCYNTKELLYKHYLTSKISCLLVQTETRTPLRHPPETDVKDEVEIQEDIGEDLDVIFQGMETVGDNGKKHKKEPVSPEAKRKKMTTADSHIEEDEDAIKLLLKKTEKQKRRIEKKKKEKKAKSVFHNA